MTAPGDAAVKMSFCHISAQGVFVTNRVRSTLFRGTAHLLWESLSVHSQRTGGVRVHLTAQAHLPREEIKLRHHLHFMDLLQDVLKLVFEGGIWPEITSLLVCLPPSLFRSS